MSEDIIINNDEAERVSYLQCNFCNTILVVQVSIPCSISSSQTIVVRCGHCCSLISISMEALLQSVNQNPDHHFHVFNLAASITSVDHTGSSSSKCNTVFGQPKKLPQSDMPRLGKRQRVPSAYNRFIKEEIQRIKANNPKINHREAFSLAAKNWAHLPHMHLGRKPDGNKQQYANNN